MAIKNKEVAYTSPSTAENQIVSEKEQAKAPTAPAPTIATILSIVSSSSAFTKSLFAIIAMVKYKNNTLPAVINPDMKLTITAGFPGLNKVKILPNIIKNGAPGGCAT